MINPPNELNLPDDAAITVQVADAVLEDLTDRLRRTRFPDVPDQQSGASWDLGTAPEELRRLISIWTDDYDWRSAESRLNELDHHRRTVDGLPIHYLRAGTRGAPPLLLLHGWPDSFLRYLDVLPLLAADFDIVVPSLPGYGLSDRPTVREMSAGRVADRMAVLMEHLGHHRFLAHGGDHGSAVAEQLALRHPDRLRGLQLSEVPYWHLFSSDPDTLSPAEQDYLHRGTTWSQSEGAYALQQSTRPTSLSPALADSPAGLAAWFLEKFRAWSDCDGDVWSSFTPQALLTNLTLYWVTGTAGSATRYYAAPSDTDSPDGPVTVPTGFVIFPADIVPAPREFGERWFNTVRWTEMPRGGHFTAWEEPELFAAELTAFAAELPPD